MKPALAFSCGSSAWRRQPRNESVQQPFSYFPPLVSGSLLGVFVLPTAPEKTPRASRRLFWRPILLRTRRDGQVRNCKSIFVRQSWSRQEGQTKLIQIWSRTVELMRLNLLFASHILLARIRSIQKASKRVAVQLLFTENCNDIAIFYG
jgi:hypothetical protein